VGTVCWCRHNSPTRIEFLRLPGGQLRVLDVIGEPECDRRDAIGLQRFVEPHRLGRIEKARDEHMGSRAMTTDGSVETGVCGVSGAALVEGGSCQAGSNVPR
jgi:hypothetical protein